MRPCNDDLIAHTVGGGPEHVIILATMAAAFPSDPSQLDFISFFSAILYLSAVSEEVLSFSRSVDN